MHERIFFKEPDEFGHLLFVCATCHSGQQFLVSPQIISDVSGDSDSPCDTAFSKEVERTITTLY
ncbi:hypothetical protein BB934_01220 [Microvirga ossetica]|uniref:Uncharacterized protein n=1 Tax=Microvirga ossetica TaxID=1882682 RepID=A0A1B2EAQ4_9HYPH|nr:hypothetical protein BB934_01220 [Microvirga ossetica]